MSSYVKKFSLQDTLKKLTSIEQWNSGSESEDEVDEDSDSGLKDDEIILHEISESDNDSESSSEEEEEKVDLPTKVDSGTSKTNKRNKVTNALSRISAKMSKPTISCQSISKDGTVWKKIKADGNSGGRFQKQNVIKFHPGMTSYSRKIKSPLDSFKLLMDDGLLRHIIDCTLDYAIQFDSNFTLSIEQINSFIGVLLLRGANGPEELPFRFTLV